MGPFSSTHYKVHVNAANRSRPGISTHFSIRFSGLCNAMQVMHRTGYVVTDMGPVSSSSPQKLKLSTSNDEVAPIEAGREFIRKLSAKTKNSSNKQNTSQRKRQRKK